MGRYTSKKARSFKRTQSCVSSCAKSKFWVFVRNESCPSDETSLVSSIWCFSSNFTGAIKAARILWQSLTLFYSKGEGKYKARKRKIKPWLILKTLLLKEQGYSQVTNAIFQLMNFSFLVNVSVIFFFHFQGLSCANVLFLATTEAAYNTLVCSWGSFWCHFRILYSNTFLLILPASILSSLCVADKLKSTAWNLTLGNHHGICY